MTKTMKFNTKSVQKIMNGLAKPFEASQAFFVLLGSKIDQQTQQTFRGLGMRKGGGSLWPTWNKGRGFNVLGGTTQTKAGTRKIRYGTDLRGKGMHGTGKIGYVRKGVRRYTGQSKLLQASGGFRKSFKLLKINKKGLMYGTQFKIAEEIMSKPARPVLFVSNTDSKQFFRLYRSFVNQRIKF